MALSADRDTKRMDGVLVPYPVAADTKIYAGGMVCANTNGYAVPGADTAGYRLLGVAQEYVDNTGGGDGDKEVLVRRIGVFEFKTSGASQADVGAVVFVADDETVAKSTTNSVYAGKIVKVDSASSVWVEIHPGDRE